MAKGDFAIVTYAVGDSSEKESIEALANGRKIEVEHDKSWLTVKETTRGGSEVRTAKFRLDAVISVISKTSED